MKIEQKKTSELIPYARNSRTHDEKQVSQIASSIKEFGFNNPVLIDGDNGIIAGHGRVMAAQLLKLETVPTIELSHLSDTQKRAYIIADNKIALNSGWDDEMLKLEMIELNDLDFNLELTGFDDFVLIDVDGETNESQSGDSDKKGSLNDKFLFAPFSVLSAREGRWQQRKKAWLDLGIKSEEGRDAKSNAKASTFANSNQSKSLSILNTGTSIFDPVLCEIAYRWFSPEGGTILDPFAGGSVRGIVASKLGRQYIGHELRDEQVTANKKQGDELCGDDELPPVWICGDSRNIDKTCHDVKADLVFSCPPYADLEVYSDNPQDLSTLGYDDFILAYREIIKKSCDRLKDDSFACFVVGEVRDKKGNYYNFVGDTIQAFLDVGLNYYNECILVTPLGTVMMQTSRNFPIGRKLGKTHQNILVFVKGDGKKAAKNCGLIEIDESLFDGLIDE
jgi:DNA modification methylase